MANLPNDNTRFKKRYMVPLWAIRIFFMVLIIGLYGWALHYTRNRENRTTLAVVVIFMLLLIICLLLDLLAIVLFARNALYPKTSLIFNVVQTTIWAIIVVLDIVAIAQGTSAAGLALSIFIFLSFLGLLIYSAIKYRREKAEKKRGHYAPAVNPANPYMPPQQYGHTSVAGSANYAQPGYPQPGYTQPGHAVELHGASTEYFSPGQFGQHPQKSSGQPGYEPPQYGYAPPAPNPFADQHHV